MGYPIIFSITEKWVMQTKWVSDISEEIIGHGFCHFSNQIKRPETLFDNPKKFLQIFLNVTPQLVQDHMFHVSESKHK